MDVVRHWNCRSGSGDAFTFSFGSLSVQLGCILGGDFSIHYHWSFRYNPFISSESLPSELQTSQMARISLRLLWSSSPSGSNKKIPCFFPFLFSVFLKLCSVSYSVQVVSIFFQGNPIDWVSTHRYHHQFCDSQRDPHSPIEGFWYSHMSWLFDTNSVVERVRIQFHGFNFTKN